MICHQMMSLPFSNIVTICGFAGAGKSILGRAFAKIHKDQFDFFDLDEVIQNDSGLLIKDIINSHGEEYFRKIEHITLRALIEEYSKQHLRKKNKAIISLGGGTLINPENQSLIKENTICIYLSCSKDVLVERLIEKDQIEKRPLLAREIKNEQDVKIAVGKYVEEGLKSRIPQYIEYSDYQIDTSIWKEEDLISKIEQLLKMDRTR